MIQVVITAAGGFSKEALTISLWKTGKFNNKFAKQAIISFCYPSVNNQNIWKTTLYGIDVENTDEIIFINAENIEGHLPQIQTLISQNIDILVYAHETSYFPCLELVKALSKDINLVHIPCEPSLYSSERAISACNSVINCGIPAEKINIVRTKIDSSHRDARASDFEEIIEFAKEKKIKIDTILTGHSAKFSLLNSD